MVAMLDRRVALRSRSVEHQHYHSSRYQFAGRIDPELTAIVLPCMFVVTNLVAHSGEIAGALTIELHAARWPFPLPMPGIEPGSPFLMAAISISPTDLSLVGIEPTMQGLSYNTTDRCRRYPAPANS